MQDHKEASSPSDLSCRTRTARCWWTAGPVRLCRPCWKGCARTMWNRATVTDVLLTHIHLDHGGAAGWWSRQGARVHVHPVGAPHLLNPEKLLASAQRIYGDDMGRLWGDFLAVPRDRLIEHADNDTIEIGGLAFTAIETPGHAEHHFAYLCEGTCFTGDIGGVRLNGAAAHSSAHTAARNQFQQMARQSRPPAPHRNHTARAHPLWFLHRCGMAPRHARKKY